MHKYVYVCTNNNDNIAQYMKTAIKSYYITPEQSEFLLGRITRQDRIALARELDCSEEHLRKIIKREAKVTADYEGALNSLISMAKGKAA